MNIGLHVNKGRLKGQYYVENYALPELYFSLKLSWVQKNLQKTTFLQLRR